jgi:hypothetical protein
LPSHLPSAPQLNGKSVWTSQLSCGSVPAKTGAQVPSAAPVRELRQDKQSLQT